MRRTGFKHSLQTIQKMSQIKTAKYDRLCGEIAEKNLKLCPNCEMKPLSEFQQVRRKSGNVHYASWCKSCTSKRQKAERLQGQFNLSVEESEKIKEYQNKSCAICGVSVSFLKKDLATDHDHKTGLIRGKLCWFCNKLLALARDNPELLVKAAVYLLSPPAVLALGSPRFGLPGRAGTKKQRKLAKRILKKGRERQIFIPQDPRMWLQNFLDNLLPSVV